MNYHEREKAYRAAEGLNQSSFKGCAKSPLHAKHDKERERKASSSQRVGILTERMIACPDDKRAIACDQTKAAGKTIASAAEERGDLVVTPAEWEQAENASKALKADPEVAELLAGCEFGVPHFWTDDGPCKALFDAVDFKRHRIIDIKTTGEDLTAKDIAATISNWGYHLQAAWYRRGYFATYGVMPEFVFVFVESKAPHGVVIVRLDDKWLAEAAEEVELLAQVYRACEAANVWPGPGQMVVNGVRTWPETLARPYWDKPYKLEV